MNQCRGGGGRIILNNFQILSNFRNNESQLNSMQQFELSRIKLVQFYCFFILLLFYYCKTHHAWDICIFIITKKPFFHYLIKDNIKIKFNVKTGWKSTRRSTDIYFVFALICSVWHNQLHIFSALWTLCRLTLPCCCCVSALLACICQTMKIT